MDSEKLKPKTKYKVSVHETAVNNMELNNFLKGISNIELSYISSLPFTQENLGVVYTKVGSQIDDIKAKLRMSNNIPPLQDYVMFGILGFKLAQAYSTKYPDSNVYISLAIGESADDIFIPDGLNIKAMSWQMFHEILANKTFSKNKFASKADKSVKSKKDNSNGKKNKPESKDIARINKINRPTEVDDEPDWSPEEQEYDPRND